MRIAIITGASSGLGEEFAKQLDRNLGKTDEIWLLARRKAALERLAESLSHKARAIAIDLTDERAQAQFAEVLAIQEPKITVLVNCAGVGSHKAFARQSREEIEGMLQVNILALTRMTKLCLPYLGKGSKVIQLASGAAFLPQENFAVYAASKSYVYSFSRALARELGGQGIGVTVVCPGPVDTPFLSLAYKDGEKPGLLKELFTAAPERVVRQAILDCKSGKRVSFHLSCRWKKAILNRAKKKDKTGKNL